MARVVIEGKELVIRLSWPEKVRHRQRDIRVPLSFVRTVQVEPKPDQFLIPSTLGMLSGWDGVKVRPGCLYLVTRSRSAIRLDLAWPPEHGTVLVSVEDPEATVAELRAALARLEEPWKAVPWWERVPAAHGAGRAD